MIDLILLSFVVGVFYGGFYLGAKFHSLKAMYEAGKAVFSK